MVLGVAGALRESAVFLFPVDTPLILHLDKNTYGKKYFFSPELKPYSSTQWNYTTIGSCYWFVQELLDKGRSPSTLKVFIAAIAAFHAPLAGQSVGRNNSVVCFLRGAKRLNQPRPLTVPTWYLPTVLPTVLPTGPTLWAATVYLYLWSLIVCCVYLE